MHVGIAKVAGKTFPAFPAHAQPAILRIWQEAHYTALSHYIYIYILNSLLLNSKSALCVAVTQTKQYGNNRSASNRNRPLHHHEVNMAQCLSTNRFLETDLCLFYPIPRDHLSFETIGSGRCGVVPLSANFCPWCPCSGNIVLFYQKQWMSDDDVMAGPHFQHYWPLVRGIYPLCYLWIPIAKAGNVKLWWFLDK